MNLNGWPPQEAAFQHPYLYLHGRLGKGGNPVRHARDSTEQHGKSISTWRRASSTHPEKIRAQLGDVCLIFRSASDENLLNVRPSSRYLRWRPVKIFIQCGAE